MIFEHAAPQDAHKLVLQVSEWLTASLSGLARHELTTYRIAGNFRLVQIFELYLHNICTVAHKDVHKGCDV